MIPRRLASELADRLASVPAVVLLGPRQVGKTTLALDPSISQGAVYLDLESERDRAKLAEPELYLQNLSGRLVILDEVHRAPELFSVLRGLIDQARMKGIRAGMYLLLGSGAPDVLQRSSESLAGRVSYMELTGFTLGEVDDADRLWLRGGFPDSYLASTEQASVDWRSDFIRTYLEREIPQLGPRLPAETLRRLWTMLAHGQGSFLNLTRLANNVGIDERTVRRYVDVLVDLMLVRRLPVWHTNVGKRLVRSPKVFVRDSGLVHSLLGIDDLETLLSHPVVGASWEGFVIEDLISALPDGWEAFTYRTHAGAEIDLVLVPRGGRPWAVEIKRSLNPKLERGFYTACEDIKAEQRLVVYPGDETFDLPRESTAVPVASMMDRLIRG